MGSGYSPSGFKVEQAMSELMQRKAALLEADPLLADDEAELVRLLEAGGEDAVAVLHALARAAVVAGNRAAGCDQLLDQLEARRDRYRRRDATLRAVLHEALVALDRPKLEAPDLTVSRKRTPPAVVITDPDLLEDRFVRITRTPNKTVLKEAMTVDGEEVKGAHMTNGGETISIKLT